MLNLLGPLQRVKNYFIKIKSVNDVCKKIASYLLPKGVHILYVELPDEKKIKGLTVFEKERIRSWCFDFNKYKEELPKLRLLYGNNITEDYILSIFDGGIVVQGESRRILLDFQSDNQHIINGRRLTVGNPNHYHNTIFTHGACTWRGTGVEDQQTIASFLQHKVNASFTNSYRVVNSAIGRGSDLSDDFQVIKEQTYQEGDIVILGSHSLPFCFGKNYFEKMGITFLETSSLFNRPHNYGEWFNDTTLHTNKRGNKVIAEAIFNKLCLSEWLNDEGVLQQDKSIDNNLMKTGEKIYGNNPKLLKYIHTLEPYKQEHKKCGCIVMNCNPFTLGHRFLIEHAASLVDILYIFVVEENKSFFPFEDRIDLVKAGTRDLQNVIVLPSGNFIISAVTFPGYFYKDDLKETKIDCSNDLNVFAQYIAPALNISVRFAGQEPLDPITNQYNEAMKSILPQYGIDFCEIERKQEGTEVISASRVRKFIESKNFDEIKKIVPPSTYEYLLNKFHN